MSAEDDLPVGPVEHLLVVLWWVFALAAILALIGLGVALAYQPGGVTRQGAAPSPGCQCP